MTIVVSMDEVNLFWLNLTKQRNASSGKKQRTQAPPIRKVVSIAPAIEMKQGLRSKKQARIKERKFPAEYQTNAPTDTTALSFSS